MPRALELDETLRCGRSHGSRRRSIEPDATDALPGPDFPVAHTHQISAKYLILLEGAAGLEPATTGLETDGRCHVQYRLVLWYRAFSLSRPLACPSSPSSYRWSC